MAFSGQQITRLGWGGFTRGAYTTFTGKPWMGLPPKGKEFMVTTGRREFMVTTGRREFKVTT